jgi:hypothetical protein
VAMLTAFPIADITPVFLKNLPTSGNALPEVFILG